jgi:CRISPR-associated protein Csb2
MLALEVTFLTGRFVATAYNTRAQSEWPPHPARLFSALVATHFEDEAPSPLERAALEWLEAAPAPGITASDCSERELATVFVPVNDTGVVNGIERHEARVLQAREALAAAADDKSSKKASTALAKAEKAALTSISKQAARPMVANENDVKKGRAILPASRTRQARTFPSVTPEDPRVAYVWEAEAPDAVRDALEALAARVVRVGHSSSLVQVRLLEEAPRPRWRPDPDGERVLRVVRAGQFEALLSAHSLHRETEPRVMPCLHLRYTERAAGPETDERTTESSCFSDRWIVLSRTKGRAGETPRLPMIAGVAVARAVRAALMRYGDEPLPPVLSGHTPDGAPLEQDHLAVVPLPFVGHDRADGTVLGVGLVLPKACPDAERRAVARALRHWEDAVRRDHEDAPTLPVHLGRAGVLPLRRQEFGETRRNLMPATWCARSRTWASVTPIALDRHPGDLWSRDDTKRRRAQEAGRKSIASACERLGLPQPARIEILPHAPWAGAAKVRAFPPYPPTAAGPRRMLTHARLVFPTLVRGPVLLGAGRYFGLGLMRPTEFGS